MKQNIDLSHNQVFSNKWNNTNKLIKLIRNNQTTIFVDYNNSKNDYNSKFLLLGNKKDRQLQRLEAEYYDESTCDKCGKKLKIPLYQIINKYRDLCPTCSKELDKIETDMNKLKQTIAFNYDKQNNINRKNQDIWWYYL